MHKIFGIRENVKYHDREGVYLIPYHANQIGVIQTPKGYFLIGGGLEGEESHMACIERECLEEAGRLPRVVGRLCSAEAYLEHPAIGHFHPIQTYYYGELLDPVSVPEETDHVLVWMDYDRLKGKLFVEMQNWALEQMAARIYKSDPA